MENAVLHRFILFVLLHEGKSCIGYMVLSFLIGRNRAIRYYFKHLFKGCDEASFVYVHNLYESTYSVKIHLIVEVEDGRLTGYLK